MTEQIYQAAFAEWAQSVARLDALETERHLRLLIQEKPSWLPQWAWNKILRRVLIMEVRFDSE